MLIGVCGALGSGKDTVGEYLVANYGFTRIAFADRLKKSAAACFGVNPENWNEWKSNRKIQIWIIDGLTPIANVSARQFLQNYGTEAHRDIFGTDFWVEQVLHRYRDGEIDDLVITDVRFDDEAAAVIRDGGFIFRVVRPGTGGDSHSSEQGISDDLIDVEIENSGTLEELYSDLRLIMGEIEDTQVSGHKLLDPAL